MQDFFAQKQQALVRALRGQIAGEVRFDASSRRLYSTDASIYQIDPLGVVIPRSIADITATVQTAGEMRVPITARGGGTSLSGQSIGPGIVLDCSKYLNNILDLDPTSRVVRVQPGVVLDTLNRALGEHNLQFGADVATASRAVMPLEKPSIKSPEALSKSTARISEARRGLRTPAAMPKRRAM